MTVIRPNSISGITSITAQANEINVFKSDGTLAGLSLNGVNVNTTTGISTYAALNVTGNVSVGGTLTYQDVTNVDAVGLITARAGVNVSGGQLDVDGHTELDNVNIAGIVTANQIKLLDSKYLQLGNSADLQLFHDGNHSYIQDNGTGNLYLTSNNFNFFSPTNEKFAVFNNNNSVELYNDNSKKFETTSYGALVTGYITANPTSGNLGFHAGDNTKMTFGSGDDLTISHDGTDDIIHSTGTSLRTRSNIFRANNAANNAVMFRSFHDGAFEAYHAGSKKFNTRAAGIDITGDLRFDTSVTGGIVRLADNQKVFCGSGDDLQIYHDSNNSYIKHSGGGNLRIETTGDANEDIFLDSYDDIYLQVADGYDAVKCIGNGAVELYYSGSKKFQTSNAGVIISGSQEVNGSCYPGSNNSYDLGTSSYRWRNVYSQDLQLSNKARKDEGGNDVDGTWGDYTIQEGESDLFLINNRNGKKYTFLLKEVT